MEDSKSSTTTAGDPGPSTQSDFTFFYSLPDVGQTVEMQPEAEHEPSRAGQKWTRNPDDWMRKHERKQG